MNRNIEEFIQDGMMEYSGYVLLNRCIPDLRDSCKPVVRRIIYTMHREKAFKFTKSATMSGKVMAIHPHSDCYPTMVGMVQTDTQILPWLIGKGNFSQHTSRDLQPASSRYSEVKLSEFAIETLKDLNQKSVNWIPNYDGTIMIPEALPVKFPMILHYCQSGIGVGMASSIPSFNMIETSDAIATYIKTNQKTNLIPDFGTGGEIINDEKVINRINNEGLGIVTLRGQYTIEDNMIFIHSIPHSTTREAIIDKVIDLIKQGKLKEVINIKDLTGLNGMSIEITCKKNCDMNNVINKLYEVTPLKSTFGANMNVLCDGLPKVMGVWDIIHKWLEWRRSCILLTYTQDIKDLSSKLNLYQGLIKILDYIDDVISIIRESEETEIINNLINKFNIDSLQAEYIADIKIRNLNKSYINRTIKDKLELENKIDKLNTITKTPSMVDDIIIEEIKSVSKKYGQPRRTKIIESKEIQEVKKEDLIEDFTTTNILTNSMYYKKTRRFADADSQKLKENDEVISTIQCSNKGKVIFISNKGDAYMSNLSDIAESKPSQLGIYLPTMLGLSNDETIIGMLSTSNYKGYAIIVYDTGKVAKINLSSYETKTNRTKLSNCLTNSENGLPLLITQITDDIDIELNDCFGKVKIVNTSSVNSKSSRSTQGVTVWNCKKTGFKVVSASVITNK